MLPGNVCSACPSTAPACARALRRFINQTHEPRRCVIDPFSLIALGLGTAGSLAGGIYNAATAGDRKKKFLKQQREQALYDLERSSASRFGLPTHELDAMARMKGVQQQADEQFKIDPMSFVPFVQNGAQLASGIYQAANQSSPQDGRLAPDPIARRQAAATAQQDALERAEALKFFQQQGWKPYGRPY